jgi:hypothetical protein
MPSPLAEFEHHFRSADTLLKVYRLLNSADGPQTEHALMPNVRDLLMARQDEELILLLNELFFGVIRERADVRPAVFRTESLRMLLRQAVVAASTALDVYYPALLRAHLSKLIQVRQRNFIPTERIVKDFLKDFNLSLDETLRVITDPGPEKVLGGLLVDYLKRKTLSNSQGVEVTLRFFAIDDPWRRITERLGDRGNHPQQQFEALVVRRNDIVHRGDHSARDIDGEIQEIQFSWTDGHIRSARSVVLACDELVLEQLRQFDLVEEAEDPLAERNDE